jgi:predicted MFS family arabinose efflux permease
VAPYGGTPADDVDPVRSGAARLAVRTFTAAARTKGFWYLAAGMMICGATTMGLIQPHFVPAAHDHGMPQTVAAGLLALVGIFDVAGTIASGWLTDRVDPRYLLLVYYVLRGLSLLALPALFGPEIQASMVAFIVFYGLDWVATIPPTMALCRELFGASAPVVFGWVFASHQVGAAAMALGAGIVRDELGAYDAAWYTGGALCVVAGLLSLLVRGRIRATDGTLAGT